MKPTRAQISRAAIQKLYISMKHLFSRGYYKPLGVSGASIKDALLDLAPEIYGDIADPYKVELEGLLYIFQRLPQGIEECQYVKLISREGYESSNFDTIVPAKRRRNCYRIDESLMYIEMTRGNSDIYDVLTHLTFMYIEAEKIRSHALDHKGQKRREWLMLEKTIKDLNAKKKINKPLAVAHVSSLIGRTYEETEAIVAEFEEAEKVNSFYNIVYWLGKLSIDEELNKNDREISFSAKLRDKVGIHIFGSIWAQNIKEHLAKVGLLEKELHVVSANMHSVRNTIYAVPALNSKKIKNSFTDHLKKLATETNNSKNNKVQAFALQQGMSRIVDNSGANIGVQVIDLAKVKKEYLPKRLQTFYTSKNTKNKVIIVMDYAFGEQAYECMDELLKPYEVGDKKIPLNIKSVNIMGKAGILTGEKGDIMIPSAFVFEGSADNYPVNNSISTKDFENSELPVYTGPMITVLGTSLQNKDILRYFLRSSWQVVGLEMEGAHYQKAVQSASKIRGSIAPDVNLRYAYYASDNPLETGSTLASGGLGIDGIKPTYEITFVILKGILSN